MIAIRVDSNPLIGLGHLMRCLVIAQQLSIKGHKVLFIVSKDTLINKIKELGFEWIVLKTDYQELEAEQEELFDLIKRKGISKILIDKYNINCEYIKKIRQKTKVIYIEDTNLLKEPVDLFINYNVYWDEYDYSTNKSDKKILGCKYAPIRQEISNIKKQVVEQKDILELLITTGGTNVEHFAYKCAKVLRSDKRFEKVNVHVLVGKYFDRLDEYRELESSGVQLYYNRALEDVIDKFDVAIATNGVTLYELAAIGIPTVIISHSGDLMGQAFEKYKAMKYMGRISNLSWEEFINSLLAICIDLGKRRSMSVNAKALVDGRGTQRIADVISRLSI